MSETTEQSLVDLRGATLPRTKAAEFTELVAEMVAGHAPDVFAIVLEYGEQVEAQIVAWGMAHDDGAYMTTVDGKNQYSLVNAENAVRYVGRRPGTTPHLVWANRSAPGPRP